jgi:hypothetical protein
MPALANMTVKKADGTTDTTYYGVQGAAGNVPAIWRGTNSSGALANIPDLRVSGRDGPRGASRILRMTYVYPEIALNTTTGVYQLVSKSRFSGEWEMSRNMSYGSVVESATQFSNLMYHTLMKTMMIEGNPAYG